MLQMDRIRDLSPSECLSQCACMAWGCARHRVIPTTSVLPLPSKSQDAAGGSGFDSLSKHSQSTHYIVGTMAISVTKKTGDTWTLPRGRVSLNI